MPLGGVGESVIHAERAALNVAIDVKCFAEALAPVASPFLARVRPLFVLHEPPR